MSSTPMNRQKKALTTKSKNLDQILFQFSIRQSLRPPPLPFPSLHLLSASFHLIPANPNMPDSFPSFNFPEPASLGVVIFLGIMLAVYYPAALFIMLKLFKRRAHRLISPRCPQTLIPLILVLLCSITVFSLSIILGKPPFCGTLDAMYLAVAVICLHFNFNIPVLVFQSDANAHKVALAQV